MRFLSVWAGLAMLTLTACGNSETDDEVAEAVEEVREEVADAIEEIQDSLEDARDDVEDAVDSARDKVEEAVDDVEHAIEDREAVQAAADAIMEAGKAAVDEARQAVNTLKHNLQMSDDGILTVSPECTAGDTAKIELRISGRAGDSYTLTMGCPGTPVVARCSAEIQPGDSFAGCAAEGTMPSSGKTSCEMDMNDKNSDQASVKLVTCTKG